MFQFRDIRIYSQIFSLKFHVVIRPFVSDIFSYYYYYYYPGKHSVTRLGWMKRLVVSYAEYSGNGVRCRVKGMGSHISVKSLGNPTICIYFPGRIFFHGSNDDKLHSLPRSWSFLGRKLVKKYLKRDTHTTSCNENREAILDFQNFLLHRATKNINKNESNIFAVRTKKLVSCNANE